MTPAERVAAYLTALKQDKNERGDAFRTQGNIARQGEYYLRQADLEALLDELDRYRNGGRGR